MLCPIADVIKRTVPSRVVPVARSRRKIDAKIYDDLSRPESHYLTPVWWVLFGHGGTCLFFGFVFCCCPPIRVSVLVAFFGCSFLFLIFPYPFSYYLFVS